jgi:hypothetical protein
MLGRALLQADDPAGVDHIRRAMSLDDEAIPAGSAILREHFANHGDHARVEEIESTAYEHAQSTNAAEAERGDLTKRDALVPSGLTAEEIRSFAKAVQWSPRLTRLWVARKVTTHERETPLLVVVAETSGWRWRRRHANDQELARQINASIALSQPAYLLTLVPNAFTPWMVRKIRKVPNACVFDRSALPTSAS